ncbi:MAG: hypothetical protein V1855_03630 [bacterium]
MKNFKVFVALLVLCSLGSIFAYQPEEKGVFDKLVQLVKLKLKEQQEQFLNQMKMQQQNSHEHTIQRDEQNAERPEEDDDDDEVIRD